MLAILETASHPNATDWDYRADIVTRPIGNTLSTIVLHPRIPADECYAIACVSADPMENVVRVVRGGVIHEAIYFAECQQPQFMWCGENIYIIGNGVSVITGGVIRAFSIPYYPRPRIR